MLPTIRNRAIKATEQQKECIRKARDLWEQGQAIVKDVVVSGRLPESSEVYLKLDRILDELKKVVSVFEVLVDGLKADKLSPWRISKHVFVSCGWDLEQHVGLVRKHGKLEDNAQVVDDWEHEWNQFFTNLLIPEKYRKAAQLKKTGATWEQVKIETGCSRASVRKYAGELLKD